jgi:23S rRNA (guanosine2251-2'-O)-methyltransferase
MKNRARPDHRSSTPRAHADRPKGERPRGPRPNNDQQRSDRPRPPRQGNANARPQSPQTDRSTQTGEVWLFGHHAVAAALANQERRVLRLLVTAEAMERLRNDSTVPQGVLGKAHTVGRADIDKVVGENAVHQGVAMLTRMIDHHLEDVLAMAEHRDSFCVVLLDQVSDPHNVGAIIRSAAAFDAAAVITLDRRAANETGTLAKSASGALDRISFVQTTNLSRAIEVLKENQFWVVGLEADGTKTLSNIDLKGRVAFVLGTEGEGLRRLVRENCDEIARLPINDASESLNVSNAAAVALYERQRQRGAK